jgi:hypothetical protein
MVSFDFALRRLKFGVRGAGLDLKLKTGAALA